MQGTQQASIGIISMERLHRIVNEGGLSELCTGGVFEGMQVGNGQPGREYTLWKLEYTGGRREQWYTLNEK